MPAQVVAVVGVAVLEVLEENVVIVEKLEDLEAVLLGAVTVI